MEVLKRLFGGGKREAAGESFRFRVSDEMDVPLRGHLLRLKVVDGEPALDDLRPGCAVRLCAPDGAERTITIKSLSTTGGRPSQERLERTRELDVVVTREAAHGDGDPVQIGWFVEGPVPNGS